MADELVFTLSIKDNASAQIDAFTRKINGIGQQAQKEFGAFRENFNKSFGDLGKPIQDINGLKTALSGLAGTGAAFAVSKAGDFIVDSVKNFAAYESALVSVQRTMGLTKGEVDSLGESLRTLALTDLKGQVMADDLAVIAEVAGSLGVAKADLIDFTKNVAMVASATDQSMEKVATSFGKITNVFKESLGGAGEAYTKIGAIGSAFDKLADDMAATVPGMLNFVNRMGGVASSMGLTVDQTAALAAVLESVGLPAERGATAMNNVMLNLMKNSKSFADALAIDAETLASALKEKPVEALQMVLKAMEELGNTKGQDELLRVMEDLMGEGNGVTEVVLKMQGAQKDLSTALASSKQAFNDATRAGESFNQAASTQEASWKSVTTAVDDLSKSLGQQLKPATEGASQGLAILATDIANTFRADNINQFFDDIIAGFDGLKSANLTDWLTALPTAAIQTVSDLRGIVTGGITDILGGISELIGAGDWFAGLVADAKAALGEVKAVIAEAFGGGMSDQEYAKEMEGIFSAQEIGIQNVTAAMGEKTAATQADLDALNALKMENLDLLRTNQELRAEYQAVASELGAAINSGITPTQDLIDRQEALRAKIADVGVEAYGNSTFPDMTAAMMTSQAQSQALTAEMAAMQAQIKGLGAEYEATDKQIQEKQDSIRDLNTQIREQQTLLRTASEAEKEGIQNTITQIRNKKDAIQGEISDLQELSRDQKEARKVEQDALKESIQQIKEKQKAVDELAKNTQRTAELRAKQQQEEAKAANDLYREQQKQAADSIKWIGEIDEASKKRLFAEQDAVKVLQEQGVELTDLQAQEVRRMQAAYQTDAAYQKQTADLEKQLAPMASLTEISTKIGEGFGKLGDNIGSLGDLFEFDTSGITSVLDKIQGFSELPKIFGEMKANITGIFDSLKGFDFGEMKANITGIFDSLKGFDLGSIFSGGGLSGMLSGLLSGLSSIAPIAGIVAAAWEPIKDLFGSIGSLFKNTKSEGTEAAEKFQDFVRSTVTGGAELAAAMDEAFHSMDFHDQFADMTDYTYQLWNAFANTPIDGVNTGLQLLYETMEAAGVPTKKLGQVAIQTFVGMQNAGYSAAEMSAKFAEMLNLTTEQAELLVQTLTGIAPPDITVNANVNLNKEAVQQSLKDIQATLEASSEYLTLHPEIKFQEFEASGLQNLSAQFEQLRAEGALTEDQFASFNNLLTAIGSDGRVTAEEINTLTTSISNIKNGTEVTTAVVQEGMNGLMSIVLDATTYMQETGATMLDFVDEAGFQGLTEQMYALGAQGILSAQQIATIEPVLQAIGTDGVVTADEIEQLRASLTAVEGQMAGAGEEGQVTSNIFDANSASARNLTDQVKTLESRLGTMTDQLTGTGTAGATTSDIFATAQMSASGLDMTTKGLSGDLVNLTGQLTGAGAETLETSNLFTMAGGSAEGLQGDVNNLDSQVATANASLAATQKALADIPNEKTVTFRVVTVGSVPKMATGGTVGAMGMAIVNERGSEIAHFPGGGMALMTAPGPTLGAFPTGTEIIPHSRSMEILSQFPGIPRMATGGTVGAMVAPVINITITGNTIANNVDIKNIAKQVSAEISRNYNARR